MKQPVRNIAIIAHVDHGKTTLVDHLLKQSGTFADHEKVEDRMMDSMDLEKERGITISAKNASFTYKNTKINIVDTPGHSDFGGEVERVLNMVDGAILLVDASEGPLPQTRFVLNKALQRDLKILVCVNKIDRKDARIDEVLSEVFDLFIDLAPREEQAEFETIYAVAKDGKAMMDPAEKDTCQDLIPLLDYLVEKFPEPKVDDDGPVQLLVTQLDYSDYLGRLVVGRLQSGKLKVGDHILVCKEDGQEKCKVTALFNYHSNEKKAVDEVYAGDIALVAGLEDVFIGDTLTSIDNPSPLPRISIEPPTVGVLVSVNDGPFAGLDGKLVTSRKIKERLSKELLYNVSLQVEDTEATDTWKVWGRGELQLAILFEQMRREGYEFLVSQPRVLYKEENGQRHEPIEKAVVDVGSDAVGIVTQKLGERKGILNGMTTHGSGDAQRTRIEFLIPSRGLIGYQSEFLTDTRGTGLLNKEFIGYEAYKGDIKSRQTGAIVSDRKGRSTGYALQALEDRGFLFVTPGTDVYDGMVVGEASKGSAMNVNVTKEKKLTNMRASGSDDTVRLTPVKPWTLEAAMSWISDKELIEVTPNHIRIRCQVLDPHKRK